MSKFIYALTDDMKDNLIKEGYKLLHNSVMNGKTAYVFVDNKNKLNFSQEDKGKYMISDRLTF